VSVAIAVIAKTPVPGRVKTRLCPPCTPAEAASLASAALQDTLAAVALTDVARRVVVLDGAPGPWIPAGFGIVPQRGDGLAERLAAAFDDIGGPVLLIGMDTPQVTPDLLAGALATLESPAVDAVLGPAPDGGYWAIGLRVPDRRVFLRIPMSTERTLIAQRARLRLLGLRTSELPRLADVDDWAGARAVAGEAPSSRFARAVRALPAAA
jgi:rSAM/selenodomain-associated transferase 1